MITRIQLCLYLLLSDFTATYEKTSSTALSANPAIAVPLMAINSWILMQRKVAGGSVSFNQNWAAYRDGFGSVTVDNYWLGLDKVYRLTQLGSLKLRVEVDELGQLHSEIPAGDLLLCIHYCIFSFHIDSTVYTVIRKK